MKKVTLLLTVLFFSSQFAFSQMRYTSEVFTDVAVQENVVYGVNATILALPTFGEAVPQPLVCDIYTPMGDSETARPLAIIAHTGNFLPPTFNGGCGGTQKDADVVELAKRLARMGYVAACIDYRLGWDPTNPDQTTRVFTIINAAYRGLQDVNTSVKYFRRSIAEFGNPYGIDGNKVVTIGFGTGAYCTYGASTIQTTEDTWTGPYVTAAGPMVIPQINGDVNADMVGIVPPGLPLPFPAGDTLCYPNHVGYDANAQLSVQFGGANGDTTWVTPGDTPMISYHVETDPFAPYNAGIVNVPPPVNLPVVEVFGAGTIVSKNVALGNNDILSMGEPLVDIHTQVADANNVQANHPNTPGLFTLFSDDPTESAPWNYAYSAEPYGVAGSDCPLLTDDIAAVRTTAVEYFIPRACRALNLGCDLASYTTTNIDELTATEVGLVAMPNPAVSQMLLKTTTQMESVLLFNAAGQLVQANYSVNDYQVTIQRNGLPSGLYVAMIKFEGGYVANKISFQ